MAEFLAFALDVLSEIRRVPTWALWLLLNLAAVTAFAVSRIPELGSHGNAFVRRAVFAMIVVVLAWAGLLIIGVVLGAIAFEKAFAQVTDEMRYGPRDADEWP